MRLLFKASLYVLGALFSASCGSGTTSDKNALMSVDLNTTTAKIDVAASVATHSESGVNRCTSQDIILATPAADTVDITVNSTANASSGLPPSNVHVRSIVVRYSAIRDSNTGVIGPYLSDRSYNSLDLLIKPSANVTIPVVVATQEDKNYLRNSLLCNSSMYLYAATIFVTVEEDTTGQRTTLQSSGVNLRFSDYK